MENASAIVEVHVTELKQLFNADRSPFDESELDSQAEDLIVRRARTVGRDGPLALLIHLERRSETAEEAATLPRAVHDAFSNRAMHSRLQLSEVLRRGRKSLVIGLAFLGVLTALGTLLSSHFGDVRFGHLASESLVIGGWVAMWRPLEFFLYDWWPIVADARLFERLATMPVRISDRSTSTNRVSSN